MSKRDANQRFTNRPTWHYMGDVNIESGGYFYSLDNWEHDYAEAVRCVPCSDAGGPDNQFWVEKITVNLPTGQNKLEQDAARVKVIADCGMDTDEYAALTEDQQQHWLLHACLDYGKYDINTTFEVQVGRKPDPMWNRSDFVSLSGSDLNVLRANVNLRNWVRAHCD